MLLNNDNIIISTQQVANDFIDAMELAEKNADKFPIPHVISIDLSPDCLLDNMKGNNNLIRTKINIDTTTKVHEFVGIANHMNGTVRLLGRDEEGTESIVNARSLVGVLYSTEWNEVWCECESGEYSKIQKFAV